MKKSLLLYLFIISLLFNVFTYMYFSRKEAFEKTAATTPKATNSAAHDSLVDMSTQLADANYFSLENDQNAQDYLNSGKNSMSYDRLIPHVKEQLMNFNDNPKGNPYTGQEQIGAQKFIINKAKVLNHRWIIADYSDGNYWGEVLLKYFINEDQSISFEVIQSIIYQKQTAE